MGVQHVRAVLFDQFAQAPCGGAHLAPMADHRQTVEPAMAARRARKLQAIHFFHGTSGGSAFGRPGRGVRRVLPR